MSDYLDTDFDQGCSGFYRVWYGRAQVPSGPHWSVKEMAKALSMTEYPSDGYVVWFQEGAGPTTVPSLNPDDLVPTCAICTGTLQESDGYAQDLRSLRLGYNYGISEGSDRFTVFDSSDTGNLYLITTCKDCRADFLRLLWAWADGGELPKRVERPEANIPVRDSGTVVMLTREEWDARYGQHDAAADSHIVLVTDTGSSLQWALAPEPGIVTMSQERAEAIAAAFDGPRGTEAGVDHGVAVEWFVPGPELSELMEGL